jgi:hypothetical protein
MNVGDEALVRVRGVIDRVTGEGKTVAQLDQSVHEIFPVAVSPTEGIILREWITREGVSNTIEIGLAYAISALFMHIRMVYGHQGASIWPANVRF